MMPHKSGLAVLARRSFIVRLDPSSRATFASKGAARNFCLGSRTVGRSYPETRRSWSLHGSPADGEFRGEPNDLSWRPAAGLAGLASMGRKRTLALGWAMDIRAAHAAEIVGVEQRRPMA